MGLASSKSILALINDDLQDQIEIDVHQELDSTNRYLLEKIPSRTTQICIANAQTNGRGRHGKTWHSPLGENIYLSISKSLKIDMNALSGLSLVVGLTLAEVLQNYCHNHIGVKWPNDILVDNKKLCGILVELKMLDEGYCQIVVGIGINLKMSDEEMSLINQPSTSLDRCEPNNRLIKNEIIAQVLNDLLPSMNLFFKNGFEMFYLKWNALDIWFDKEVLLVIGNKTVMGIHKGIDQSGALLLEVDGELTIWHSGEISLRGVSNDSTN